jgi:hypothetical protein
MEGKFSEVELPLYGVLSSLPIKLCEVHTHRLSQSVLRIGCQSVLFSGLGDCPNTILSFLSRAPKRCLPRIYEGIPQVDCFLALSCSRKAGDELPMNSPKELHGFPRVRGRSFLRTPEPGAGVAPVEYHPIGPGPIHALGFLCTTTICRSHLRSLSGLGSHPRGSGRAIYAGLPI